MKEEILKIKSQKHTVFLAVLSGVSLLFSFSALFCALSNTPPSLGIIDVQALVASQAQKFSKTSLDHHPDSLQKTARLIREKANSWASAHHVILLSKSGVWRDDLPDYTAVIQDLLKEPS